MTDAAVFTGDVAIVGEKIIAVTAPGVISEAKRVINAEGKLLFPGVIDTHAHIEEPFQGCVPEENWELGTRAAAIGGTTTVFNFVIQPKGTPLPEAVQAHHKRADSLSLIDFNFHGVFTDFSNMEQVLSDISRTVEYGVTSFKEFMIYTDEGLNVSDWQLLSTLREISACGGILGVHAENCTIGENMTAELAASGRTRAVDWPDAKPNFVEAEAVQRALSIADYVGGNLYIVHTSTAEAVDMIKKYRCTGAPLFLETCPHYLVFTRDRYNKEDGKYQVISPPLREQKDVNALWTALASGMISIVGSDHNAYGKKDKDPGYEKDGFMGVANGQPGIFEILTLLYNFGKRNNRLSLRRIAEVTSTNAARMFGIYPRKGTIAPGSDADIVIFDPEKKETLGSQWYEGVDTSFYEGLQVEGFPVMTLIRGNIISEEGRITAEKGSGTFIPGTCTKDMYRDIH